MNIKLKEIKGFEKLSLAGKKVFLSTLGKHYEHLSDESKEKYRPVKVKEHKDYIEVHFSSGEWLHYTASGEWYQSDFKNQPEPVLN